MRTVRNNFNFTKGLITEASPLNYPENACLDILNVDLFRTGLNARRRALAAEDGYQLLPETPFNNSVLSNQGLCANVWKSVGTDSNTNFVMVQIGATLYFHDSSAPGALSQNVEPFNVDLSPFASAPTVDAGRYQVAVVSGLGFLFAVSPAINPILLQYSPAAPPSVVATAPTINIRDTVGVDDGLAVNERPPTLTPEHNYNLLNQGWTTDTINSYRSTNGVYPSNAEVWWSSKDAAGAFDPAGMLNIAFGNTPAARGHFILNLFSQDRSTVSGIAGIPLITITARPSAIAYFYGRLCIAVGETVYYSQVIENISQATNFYQAADPASEIDNLLVPSDGGSIPLPGSGVITTLLNTETSLVAGASEGIWAITGYSGNSFNATLYRTMFVADTGVLSQNNICQVEETLFCVSDGGIYVYTTSDRGNIDISNITETTIQTYFLSINRQARQDSFSFYDNAAKKYYMLFNSNAGNEGGLYRNQYDSALVFDYTLKAWTKHQLATPAGFRCFISDAFLLNSPIFNQVQLNVVVGNLQVVVGNLDVVIDDFVPLAQPTSVGFLLISGNNTDGYQYTFGDFSGSTFYDFSYVNGGASYDSYILMGYQLLDDVVHRKSVPSFWGQFNRTESNWINNGFDQPVPDFPSSCYLQAIWEWAGQYGVFLTTFKQQIYRFRWPRVITGNIGEPFVYPNTVLQTKTTLPGNGKCVSLLLSSEPGKDFQCFGSAIEYQVKDTPS